MFGNNILFWGWGRGKAEYVCRLVLPAWAQWFGLWMCASTVDGPCVGGPALLLRWGRGVGAVLWVGVECLSYCSQVQHSAECMHIACSCALSLPTAQLMHPFVRDGGGLCVCVCVRAQRPTIFKSIIAFANIHHCSNVPITYSSALSAHSARQHGYIQSMHPFLTPIPPMPWRVPAPVRGPPWSELATAHGV